MAYSKQHYQALDELYVYMTGILKVYQNLIPLLRKELDAILSEDTTTLDEVMNSQQAVILRTRDFDEKMAKFGKDIEVPNTNLKVLADSLPQEDGERFAKLHEDFKVTIEEVLFYRNKCKDMLTSRLVFLGDALGRMGDPQETTTYNSSAAEVQTSVFPKSFQTKI